MFPYQWNTYPLWYVFPTKERHIPSDMCCPTREIHAKWCVPLHGKPISLVIGVPPPRKNISLVICIPLHRKHISLVICVPLPGTRIHIHILSDMCSPTRQKGLNNAQITLSSRHLEMIREKEWSVKRLPSPTSPSHALFFLRPFYSSLTNDKLYEAITMAKLQVDE